LMEKPEDRFASADEARAMLDEAAVPLRPSAIYPRSWAGLHAGASREPSGGAELSEEMRSIWDRSGDVRTGSGSRGRAS
jgi:hypothetical protein